MITEFNRDNLTEMRKELDAVLSKYGSDEGVRFEIGKMTYGGNEVRFKVTSFTKTRQTVIDPLAHSGRPSSSSNVSDADLASYGLKRFNDKGWEITKLYPNRPMYKFIYTKPSGAVYKAKRASMTIDV